VLHPSRTGRADFLISPSHTGGNGGICRVFPTENRPARAILTAPPHSAGLLGNPPGFLPTAGALAGSNPVAVMHLASEITWR